jgi:cell division protein FtsL
MRWLRVSTLASAALMLLCAFGLYAIKNDTRLALDHKRSLDQRIVEQEAAIAVLKAEKATLTRPERIEQLTKRHLSLAPMQPGQIAVMADLPWREPELGAATPGTAVEVPGLPQPATGLAAVVP